MKQKKIVPFLCIGIVGLSLLSYYAYNLSQQQPPKKTPQIEPDSDKEEEEKEEEEKEEE